MKINLKKFAILCVVSLFVVSAFVGVFIKLPATAANMSGSTGDCTWNLSGTVLTISGNGAMENYSYSSQPWGANITEVIIKEGVTSIGNYAFYECASLTDVTIPNSVTSIGKYAFGFCDTLKKVNISDVGSWCNIKFANKNGNPLYYGAELYMNGAVVSNLVIPASVTSVGDYVFEGCKFLKSVSIGENVTSIGYRSFYECTNLESVVIGNKVSSVGSYAFYNCDKLASVTYGSGIVNIRSYAFYDCDALKSISLPATLTTLGDYAFVGCGAIETIEVDSNNTKYRSSGNCLINVAEKAVIYGCKNSVIPSDDSVTSIKEKVFEQCVGLTSVVIPDNITFIGANAFDRCTGLESVEIGNGVTAINDSTFYNCTSLTSVSLGQNITSIGKTAFSFCTDLATINFPDSVVSIGEYAFNNCDKLTTISLGANLTVIPEYCFYDCDAITTIFIPASVTSIGNFAFSGCGAVGAIEVAEENTVYQSSENCLIDTAAKKLVFGCKNSAIPDDGSVEIIGEYSFFECASLDSIKIPASVTTIEANAFESCAKLASIEIPASVNTIGDHAFKSCAALNNVTFYIGEIYIGEAAFDNCAKFNTVWYEGNAEDKKQISIHENNSKFNAAKWNYDACMLNSAAEKKHVFDHDCDTDCNLGCGFEREITHKFDWVVTKNETCGEDGVKYQKCSVCDYITNENTPIPATGLHRYINNCDVDCDVCGHERVPFDHVYDHACDADCNVCGEEHIFEHVYTDVCDKTCDTVGCGFVREAPHVFDNKCDTDCNACDLTRVTYHTPENGFCTECGIKAVRPVSAQLVIDKKISVRLYFNKSDVDEDFTYRVILDGKDSPIASGSYGDLKRSGNYYILTIEGIGLEDFNKNFTILGKTFWDANVDRYNSVVKLADLGVKSYEAPKYKQLFKSIADLGRVASGEESKYGLVPDIEASGASGVGPEEGAELIFTGKNLLMNDSMGIRLYGKTQNVEALDGIKVLVDGNDITSKCVISTPVLNGEYYEFSVDVYISVSKMEESMTFLITDGNGKRCIQLTDRVDWVAQLIINKEPNNLLAKQVLIYIQAVNGYLKDNAVIKPSVPGEETEIGGKLEF